MRFQGKKKFFSRFKNLTTNLGFKKFSIIIDDDAETISYHIVESKTRNQTLSGSIFYPNQCDVP